MKITTTAIWLSLLFLAFNSDAGYVLSVASLTGKAEIQRAGSQAWIVADKGASLLNNDIIRSLENSTVFLRSGDGDTIIMRPGSQLLVNSMENAPAGVSSRTVTVFFGAAFFVVKKVLPKTVVSLWDYKVYSPTTVVAVRGSAFSVEVDKKTGSSIIRTIEGTVMVKNILRNTSYYLTYPNQTTVSMNADPSVPKPFAQKEVDALYTWVPQDIIDALITRQLTTSRENRQKITGGLEDKILVIPFVNSSKYKGAWDIGTKLADAMASLIIRSNTPLAVNVNGTAGDDPQKTGTALNGRFIVSGEVTQFDIAQYAEVNADATQYDEYNVAKFTIKLRVDDAREKKLLYENAFDGEVSGKNTPENSWQMIGQMAFDVTDPAFNTSILGKAIRQALDQSIGPVTQYLPR